MPILVHRFAGALSLLGSLCLAAGALTACGDETRARAQPRVPHSTAAASTSPALPAVRPVTAATRGGYVSLGDSFTSGSGTGTCGRSGKAYPHLVAGHFHFAAKPAYAACSGATTAGITGPEQGSDPQISRVTATTSLVTLQVGGNDLGFTSVLTTCVLQSPGSSACRAQEPDIRERLTTLKADLRGAVTKIRAAAPRARVLLLGYPHLFPYRPKRQASDLEPRDQRWLNDMTNLINEGVRSTAKRADAAIKPGGQGSVEYVDVTGAFGGHELGRADPYVQALQVDFQNFTVGKGSFHPTVAGQKELAKRVEEQITTGPGRPLH